MVLVLLLLLTADLLLYKAIWNIINRKFGKKQKKAFTLLFWLHSIIFLTGTILVASWMHSDNDPSVQKRIYGFAGMLIAFYIPKLIFIPFGFLEDLINLCLKLTSKLFSKRKQTISVNSQKITRTTFLTKTGLIIAAIPFGSLLFGLTSIKFNFRINRINLQFKDIPDKFSGISVVQISDLHLGSLYGHQKQISRAVEMINSLSPDIIFFTGDLVNDFASEINGWFEVFGKLKAGIGKYSILGNHDYGDYHYWESDIAKKENLEKIKKAHHQLGFRLLLNESDILSIEDAKIAIIGVENWGEPPFAQYGDIEKAYKGIEQIPFKILLTHDPSHWDAEILNKKEIQLTLSGHTHGMQFGLRAGKLKWSPVQIKYPRWIGLYTEKDQKLYVNPGLGYIGYPGRVGISPEITYFEINKNLNSS